MARLGATRPEGDTIDWSSPVHDETPLWPMKKLLRHFLSPGIMLFIHIVVLIMLLRLKGYCRCGGLGRLLRTPFTSLERRMKSKFRRHPRGRSGDEEGGMPLQDRHTLMNSATESSSNLSASKNSGTTRPDISANHRVAPIHLGVDMDGSSADPRPSEVRNRVHFYPVHGPNALPNGLPNGPVHANGGPVNGMANSGPRRPNPSPLANGFVVGGPRRPNPSPLGNEVTLAVNGMDGRTDYMAEMTEDEIAGADM